MPVEDAPSFGGDSFSKLQAIIAGLPQYALLAEDPCNCCCASRAGGCFCCCHPRVIENLPWALPCNERVEIGLTLAKDEYPVFKEELGRLRVVFASYDLAILVDNDEKRMFTSVRGTSCRACRDLGNDAVIVMGCWLPRTRWLREEYQFFRSLHPDHTSYGCGHSLGGTVMTELAHIYESDKKFAFDRVDVFEAGGSPISRPYALQGLTEYRHHRVAGDLVSRYFQTSGGQFHEHPHRSEYSAHSLQHFLPERFSETLNDWIGDGWGCSGRRKNELTDTKISAIGEPKSQTEGKTKRPVIAANEEPAQGCSSQANNDANPQESSSHSISDEKLRLMGD